MSTQPLENIITGLTENSLVTKIENPGLFKRIVNYFSGGHATTVKYRKPVVNIAASILLLAAPLVEKLKAATYSVKPRQNIQSVIDDPNVINGEIIIVTDGVYMGADTKFIPKDTSIGTWDPINRMYTLTTDVSGTVQIDEDNLTLDGAGHTVTGPGSGPAWGYGIYLHNRTGVTIKNLNVQQFTWGVYLHDSSNNTITGSTVMNNGYGGGIHLSYSSGNTLVGNTASGNDIGGIYLSYSNDNTLTNNTCSNKGHGIFLYRSSGNALRNNVASNNYPFNGIYLYDTSNNTLMSNVAGNNGLGIYIQNSSGNTLTANVVSNNGSGIIIQGVSNTTLLDNAVSDNTHSGINLDGVSGCTLTGNIMSRNRYNFGLSGWSDSHFDNSIDTTNTVGGKFIYYLKNAIDQVYDNSMNVGTIYAINSNNITIRDLTLTNNKHGVFLWRTHSSTIENIIASDNRTGIHMSNSSYNTLINSIISRNQGLGGILCDNSSPTITNNTIIGNFAWEFGAGIACTNNSSPLITNITITGNYTWESGGSIWCYNNSSPIITNCIFWKNIPNEVEAWQSCNPTITYSDIQGGWPGEGNINIDPNFAKLGYWDNNGTPDDPEDDFFVEGNYHLKSQAGRWNPNKKEWVLDDVTSPCIDAGDPMSPIMYESFPNGGIINMGAYGGTPEASKSYFGKPNCETIVAGDINGDCKVDFRDFAIMALHWLERADSNYHLPGHE